MFGTHDLDSLFLCIKVWLEKVGECIERFSPLFVPIVTSHLVVVRRQLYQDLKVPNEVHRFRPIDQERLQSPRILKSKGVQTVEDGYSLLPHLVVDLQYSNIDVF